MLRIGNRIGFGGRRLMKITGSGTGDTAGPGTVLQGDIAPGDLMLLLDLASNAGAAPAEVIPSGWTKMLSDDNGGSAHRASLSFRLADGTEGGTTITSQDGATDRKLVAYLRGTPPIKAASLIAGSYSITGGNPPSITVDPRLTSCPVLVFGCYFSPDGVGTRTFNVNGVDANDGALAGSESDVVLEWKLFNDVPQQCVVDMADTGIFNLVAGGYFALR